MMVTMERTLVERYADGEVQDTDAAMDACLSEWRRDKSQDTWNALRRRLGLSYEEFTDWAERKTTLQCALASAASRMVARRRD